MSEITKLVSCVREFKMLTTIWAEVRDGKVELTEDVALAEGARVLVTVLSQENENGFWLQASHAALDEVWNNAEDDVYAELL